jgi:hypothetical protein
MNKVQKDRKNRNAACIEGIIFKGGVCIDLHVGLCFHRLCWLQTDSWCDEVIRRTIE